MSFGENGMRIILCSFLLLCTAGAHSKEQKIQCPVRYPAQGVKLVEVPAAWDGVGKVSANALLDGGGVIAGPESGRGEMMGSGAVKTKEGQEVRYPLPGGEKWFFCSYGNGSVELWHRIASDATSCVVKTKRLKLHDDPDVKAICN